MTPARSAGDFPADPAVVVLNPDDVVTPEAFTTWLDRPQVGDPVAPASRAAQTRRRGTSHRAVAISCEPVPIAYSAAALAL